MTTRSATAFPALLALAAEGAAPDWVQLVPAGESRAVDGRTFRLDDPAAVIAASMEAGLDLPIDWEHAQDRRAEDGGIAPAAGWIVELAERDGAIWGRVQWTERGRASVEGREYRYVSPSMLQHRKTNRVLRIIGAGLVNRPALVMPALARETTTEEPDMDKELLEALGLKPEASKADALEAVGKLKGDLHTAQARAETPSLDKFVPRADYDAVVARAETAETTLANRDNETREAEIAALVDGAVTAGKIAPANRDFYVATAREEGGLERLKTFVESAPQVVAKSGLDDKDAPGGAGTLTDAETVVCRQLGMTEEDFAKSRDEETR
ncbi:hypothetical protein HW532_19100 [Kaustia mangrovi]|uniref:Mu-like prophage I protein n=1 Tax=Kaustia mangrovi TaxID=2593653 RepID=A0A7S8HDL9_9HYPH|nr:phage protease [Kaustia mangrovi]QPC44624.1 hypothetical protein HW532_19100 [Kaustia mangrovi]